MKNRIYLFALAWVLGKALSAQQLIAPQNLFVLSAQERALFNPPANWFPLSWTGYEGPPLKGLWEAFDNGLPPVPVNASQSASGWYNLNGTGSENHAMLWIGESALGNALANDVVQYEIAAKKAIFLLDSMDLVQGHMRHEAIGLYVGFWEGGAAAMALAGLYAPAGSTSGPQLLASARRWWADHIAVLRALRMPDGQVARLGARMNHGQPGGDDDENVKCALNLQLIDPQPYNTLHPFITSRITIDGEPKASTSPGNPIMWHEPRAAAERWTVLRAFQAGALLRVPANQPTPLVIDDIYKWSSGNTTYVATPVVTGYPNCRWKVSWTAGQLLHIIVSDTGNTNGAKVAHPAPGWQAPLNIPTNAKHILGPPFTTPDPTCAQNSSCGNDAAVISIAKPYHRGCVTNINPVVVVKNTGTTPITNFSLYYRIDNFSLYSEYASGAVKSKNYVVTQGPGLLPDSLATLTLDVSTVTPGAHTIKVWIMDVNKMTDVNASNDAISSSFTVVTAGYPLPYTQDFENVTPGQIPGNFSYYDGDDHEKWFVFASSGNQAAALSNFTYSGAVNSQDELVLSVLNFSGQPQVYLSFDYSHASRSNSLKYDSLEVQISTDCGTTFTTIWNKGGSALNTVPDQSTIFIPAGPQDYQNAQVNLSAYTQFSKVIIKFINWSNEGNSTLIDNINIGNLQSTGVENLSALSTNVYPNPANDLLHVNFYSNAKNTMNVKLINLLGETMKEENYTAGTGFNTTSIDISNYTPGVYNLILSDAGGKAICKKIIIAR